MFLACPKCGENAVRRHTEDGTNGACNHCGVVLNSEQMERPLRRPIVPNKEWAIWQKWLRER